jgi:hypothetical protein
MIWIVQCTGSIYSIRDTVIYVQYICYSTVCSTSTTVLNLDCLFSIWRSKVQGTVLFIRALSTARHWISIPSCRPTPCHNRLVAMLWLPSVGNYHRRRVYLPMFLFILEFLYLLIGSTPVHPKYVQSLLCGHKFTAGKYYWNVRGSATPSVWEVDK